VELKGVKAVKIYFSPGADLTAAVVEAIDGAKESVLVQAYSFTSKPIADALMRAHGRGVNVEVTIEKVRQIEKGSMVSPLREAGISVFTDDKHRAAHNKVMVIDETTVVTGSFNFSEGGRGNAENMLVIKDKRLAKHYKANWERHREHSDVK
jgi:phosphatidylserine/phosphatidylglycerophosphate/cardiolipin synthase-like enzyme